MEILKASGKTEPGKLAGAIAEVMRTNPRVKIKAIGAGAVNQSIKAVAIARGFVAPSGIDLVVIPGFENVLMGEGEKTVINLTVEGR